jgi:hypothetical protein
VWNTPYAGIRVIPTKVIVQKVIDAGLYAMPENWQDALYGPIKLPQNILSDLK